MSILYNIAKAPGNIDFNTDDLRVILCEAATTADTDVDADNLSDITTLAESDDSTKTRPALTTETVAVDDSADRATFNADDVTFNLAGDGTGTNYVGVLIYKHVDGLPGNDVPVAFMDFPTAVPLTTNTLNVVWDTVILAWLQAIGNSYIYNAAKAALADKTIDFENDTINAILVYDGTNAGSVNDGIQFVNDITTLNESTDTGYSRQTLTGKSSQTPDDTLDRGVLDANNPVFALNGNGLGTNYVGIVLYKHVTNDADSPVLAYIDFTTDVPVGASQITVPFASTGIAYLGA